MKGREFLIRQAAADKDFQGVIIYPYIKGGREVLVGVSSDPQFGPVVVFGMGGVYAEIFKDISMRVAPVDVAEAKIMVGETKLFKLLKGARGGKPVDIKALAELIAIVSQLPFQYPEIDEMDLNPVFMFQEGLLVGDVRVIRKNK